jgi:hypothetical protein
MCLVMGGALAMPAIAHACTCTGVVPSSASFRASAAVFVGKVVRIDKQTAVAFDGNTTFDVLHVFRGRLERQAVMLPGGGTCSEPFEVGQTWLVYAFDSGGALTTNRCTRSRLRDEAAQDIAYLEGVEQGRAQGVVYGEMLHRRLGADGQPGLFASPESLQVVAVGAGGRFTAQSERGHYQIALPPGDFQLWVDRSGQRVSEVQRVSVTADTDHHLMVIASF